MVVLSFGATWLAMKVVEHLINRTITKATEGAKKKFFPEWRNEIKGLMEEILKKAGITNEDIKIGSLSENIQKERVGEKDYTNLEDTIVQ
ncbi:MAG: hypothetical protein ACTSUE_23300 [Promethearchaeota archaeon]